MERLLKRVHASAALTQALRWLSHITTAYAVGLLALLLYDSWRLSELSAMKLTLILALPFLAVSLVRKLVHAPRPYELYDFYGSEIRHKEGESFPSRHAHSAFAIGVAALPRLPVLGAVLLALGALMCVARVLLGIHFIRDVVAGALCGTLTSVIGLLIAQPFPFI